MKTKLEADEKFIGSTSLGPAKEFWTEFHSRNFIVTNKRILTENVTISRGWVFDSKSDQNYPKYNVQEWSKIKAIKNDGKHRNFAEKFTHGMHAAHSTHALPHAIGVPARILVGVITGLDLIAGDVTYKLVIVNTNSGKEETIFYHVEEKHIKESGKESLGELTKSSGLDFVITDT